LLGGGLHVESGHPQRTPMISIRFRDPLRGFAQRCWDSNAELRLKVGEVAECLKEAVDNCGGFMPPQVRVVTQGGASDSEGTSDSSSPSLAQQQRRSFCESV